MKSTSCYVLTFVAIFGTAIPDPVLSCTEASSSAPEIEIEVEFEDYNDVRDRVIYKIEVEAEIMAPMQSAICQCGINFGSAALTAPDSFNVLNAIVGVSKDDGDDFDLEAFEGFAEDRDVGNMLSGLPSFRNGGTPYGFSANVDTFSLPPLQAEDAYVLAFLIEFAPEDFDRVNGNLIQFAAGSNEPGHPLNIFRNYQPNLRLPAFQLHECDFNLDQACDANDINAFYSLGRVDVGFERVDATEKFDLNGDDRISLADLDEWLEVAADYNELPDSYVYGDANLDGEFGPADMIQAFQVGEYETGRSGQTWASGDWNGDGLFNSTDLIRAFRTGAYEKSNTAAVPEPNHHAVLILLTLCCVHRSRRNRCGEFNRLEPA